MFRPSSPLRNVQTLVRRVLAPRHKPRPDKTPIHSAVTELMSSKKSKPAPTAEDVEPTSTLEKAKNLVKGWDPRNGLGIYIDAPEENPEGRIVSYDDEFVVIRDKFPKASYVPCHATSIYIYNIANESPR
jgi:hypothetical protein